MSILRPVAASAALLALLSACANPEVAPRLTPNERTMSCAEIENDVSRTSHLKREARADDEFQWRYIFVVNGFVSAYRINKAERAAQERLEGLREMGQAKGCFGSEDKIVSGDTPVTAPTVDGQLR